MKGMETVQKFRDLQVKKVTTSWAQTLKGGISKDFATKSQWIFPVDEMTGDKEWINCVSFSPIIQTSQGSHYEVDRQTHGSVKQWNKADCRPLSRKEVLVWLLAHGACWKQIHQKPTLCEGTVLPNKPWVCI